MKLYFKVLNEEHSEKIQQELFKLGYHWADHSAPNEIVKDCFYITTGIESKSIHNSKELKYVEGHQFCTLDDLIAYHEDYEKHELSYGLNAFINHHFGVVTICNKEITFGEIAELNFVVNGEED